MKSARSTIAAVSIALGCLDCVVPQFAQAQAPTPPAGKSAASGPKANSGATKSTTNKSTSGSITFQTYSVHVTIPYLGSRLSPAKSILKRAESQIQSAAMVTYSVLETSDLLSNSSRRGPIFISGILQKPNLFHVEATLPDRSKYLVVSDGKRMYSFYPATKKYIERPAPSSFGWAINYVNLDALTLTDYRLQGLQLFDFALYADPQTAGLDDLDQAKSVSVKDLNVNGTAQTRLAVQSEDDWEDGKSKPGMYTYYYIDRATGLFRTIRFLAPGRVGATMNVDTTELKTIQLGKRPLPISSFAFTPPAGAQAVTAPSVPGMPDPATIGRAFIHAGPSNR